jgi:uncharacterized protein (TIGR02246 family)
MYMNPGGAGALSARDVVALTSNWVATVCRHNPAAVAALYAPDGVLVGTVAQRIKQGRADIKTYFNTFLRKDGICGQFNSHLVQSYPGWAVHSGTYTFAWRENGRVVEVPARFTFVWCDVPGEGWRIANHHSSALPD